MQQGHSLRNCWWLAVGSSKMKTLRSPLQNAYFRSSIPNFRFLTPIKSQVHVKYAKISSSSPVSVNIDTTSLRGQIPKHPAERSDPKKPLVSEVASQSLNEYSPGTSNFVVIGAVTAVVALILMGFDEQKALAFGPEGPLVEEFWDNMRRYALYVLTVSTGVVYTVFQPILELLRNPISAILILTIIGGSIYIVSQVLSAMVGVSDFSYDYSY